MRSYFLNCVLNFSILIIKANGETSESLSSLDKNPQTFANKDNVEVACICPAIYKPVCGSDGKTYSNPCALSCARNTNRFLFGLCEGECPCCNEPFYNAPRDNQEIGFWGWDRITASPHVTLIAKLEDGFDVKLSNKNCNKTISVPDCACPKNYKPVCGSDGNTYGNACVLECQQRLRPCLLQACAGECPCCPGACSATETPPATQRKYA